MLGSVRQFIRVLLADHGDYRALQMESSVQVSRIAAVSVSLGLLSFCPTQCRNCVILLPSSGFTFISAFYSSSKTAFRNKFSVPHCLQICISVLNGLNSRDGCRVHILGFYGSKWNFFQDCLQELIQGTIVG